MLKHNNENLSYEMCMFAYKQNRNMQVIVTQKYRNKKKYKRTKESVAADETTQHRAVF